MRTALVLLFLLALAAIPGALLPQRSLNAGKVDEYIAPGRPSVRSWTGSNCSTCSAASGSPRSTSCCSSLSSAAFCRAASTHYRALRTPPVPAPRNFAPPAAPRRDHRGRCARRGARPGTRAVARVAGRSVARADLALATASSPLSAEKGYLREVRKPGLPHLARRVARRPIAVGKLFGYEGQRIVVANGGQNSARPRPRRSTRSSPGERSTAPA